LSATQTPNTLDCYSNSNLSNMLKCSAILCWICKR
jgi:hypothetical protein